MQILAEILYCKCSRAPLVCNPPGQVPGSSSSSKLYCSRLCHYSTAVETLSSGSLLHSTATILGNITSVDVWQLVRALASMLDSRQQMVQQDPSSLHTVVVILGARIWIVNISLIHSLLPSTATAALDRSCPSYCCCCVCACDFQESTHLC